MKTLPIKLIISIILPLLVLVTSIPGCTSSSSPLQASLSFSGPPDLNKLVQVTAVFSLLKDFKYDLHDVTAEIILPEGIEKVEGELVWQGDIAYGTTHSLTAKVRSIKTGEYIVEARSDCRPSENQYYVGNAKLYISVTEDGTVVSDRKPFNTHSTGSYVQPTGSRRTPFTRPPSSESSNTGNQSYSSP
jgi:hypothetical protein